MSSVMLTFSLSIALLVGCEARLNAAKDQRSQPLPDPIDSDSPATDELDGLGDEEKKEPTPNPTADAELEATAIRLGQATLNQCDVAIDIEIDLLANSAKPKILTGLTGSIANVTSTIDTWIIPADTMDPLTAVLRGTVTSAAATLTAQSSLPQLDNPLSDSLELELIDVSAQSLAAIPRAADIAVDSVSVSGKQVAFDTDDANCNGTCSGLEGSLALGLGHSCLLLSNRTVKCWGRNDYGQLGTGTFNDSSVPMLVVDATDTPIDSFRWIQAGPYFTCGGLMDGTLRCWGSGSFGRLGNGLAANSAYPVEVQSVATASALVGVTQVSMGANSTCALLTSNGVACWGRNNAGQLSVGNSTTNSATTAQTALLDNTPADLTDVVQISSGADHKCGLFVDGTVKCWGYGNEGQLGNNLSGASLSRVYPVVVWATEAGGQLGDILVLELGALHSCAITTDNHVKCWGYNDKGQLGYGSSSLDGVAHNLRPFPDYVLTAPGTPLEGVVSLAGALDSNCALLRDGTVMCWGSNSHSQLGNDDIAPGTASPYPVVVNGLKDVVALEGSETHYCALLLDGSLVCWGNNTNGQLGNGGTDSSAVPVTVVDGLQPVVGAVERCPSVKLAD